AGNGRQAGAARVAHRHPRPRAGHAGAGMNAAAPAAAANPIDWARVRADFPLLERRVHGKPLVYFDSANTGQKPAAVIAAVDEFYREHNANVSRAVHALGSEATEAYEGARRKLAAHVNVRADELVLTSGTTFAINLVAYSWALPRLGPGDAILLTRMEHHANIVPWQLVAARTGAEVRVVDITPEGALDLDALQAAMTPDVKLLGVVHVSNVLGTVNPVREICRMARKRGIATLVDGSQALPHMPVDVAAIGCDFYALTGHKMCGPTGTGALWARREHLEAMPPFRGGGEMIREVSFEGTVGHDPPHRSEGGHAEHRRARRPGHRGGLPRRHRHGCDRRARGRAARAPAGRDAPGRRPAHHRHRAGQGGGRLFPGRGRARARPRHPARPGRRGGAFRAPLRAPADGLLRRAGDLPRLARVLQHARGDRSLHRRAAEGAQTACVTWGPLPWGRS